MHFLTCRVEDAACAVHHGGLRPCDHKHEMYRALWKCVGGVWWRRFPTSSKRFDGQLKLEVWSGSGGAFSDRRRWRWPKVDFIAADESHAGADCGFASAKVH